MNLVVVTVPVYKEQMTDGEILSLKQLSHTLHSYPIVLVCPLGLNVEAYQFICPSITIRSFDPIFFENIDGYNKLLLATEFYEVFAEYKFILIHQLDAYIFRNELQYWCDRNYDYIGAPWFRGMAHADKKSEIIGVGNGGLSLRKIESSIRILKRTQKLRNLRFWWFKSRLQSVVTFPSVLKMLRSKFKIASLNRLNELLFYHGTNEDYFWTEISGRTFRDFKIAPAEEAMRFSFEVNPSLLYQMNVNKLPFGCHAWEKYEPEFWKQFIADPQLNLSERS
ncbi:MAG: hypothetical protein EOO43_02950 [Flavobacterium sp.]|nr:MAG: hypothetical protein EOO43_02950 [Flavobacterium sp.]